MMKQQYKEPMDLTEQTHQAGDQNKCWNYHLLDSHKMINREEGSREEEDSQEEEDSLEGEDSLEEGDTRAEEEYHPEDHQEVVGDHHHYLCHKPLKGS